MAASIGSRARLYGGIDNGIDTVSLLKPNRKPRKADRVDLAIRYTELSGFLEIRIAKFRTNNDAT